MEYLLHYVWQHRCYDASNLITAQGQKIEVLDPGIHNIMYSGPDFINAKIKVEGVVWAGNVEIHLRSSDWKRHHHESDEAYNNVILHIAEQIDTDVQTAAGRTLPQLQLSIPEKLEANYRELQMEETYPPCYRVIPKLPLLTVHSWMSRLSVERLEEKTRRIDDYLRRTADDWERVFFITLARNFGFGTNSAAFELWAFSIDLSFLGKHRDDPLQVEAFFIGQAGLLDESLVSPERRDDYFRLLQREYEFLRHKFGLQPVSSALWRFGRLRPQNFPYVRLSQLARLYSEHQVNFSMLLETRSNEDFRRLFRVGVTDYWRTHYTFGVESRSVEKTLRESSLDLLLINTVSPLLFAYGRHLMDEDLSERAFRILEQIPPERNYITRSWQRAGIAVEHAADSQALIQLRQHYCERKDCLRCRFGSAYLRQ